EVASVAAPVKKSFPVWIIPVIAVVLIALGLTLWLLLRTRKVDVPNVVGKTVAEATSDLEANKLKANVAETKVTGTMGAGLVTSQTPEPGGDKVAEGSTVDLVVEGEPTPTPTPTPDASPTPTATPSVAPPAPFAGRWINVDPNTRSNTRIDILQKDTQLKVHAWGKCHPTDCDWGTVDGGVIGNDGIVAWDQGFVLRKMVIRLIGNDQIQVTTDSVYNDNRPRQQIQETFKRQSRLIDVRVTRATAAETMKIREALKAEDARKSTP
ncbi:MAG TPA: PASTA domain-containing protein, partial [Pyrinomonadaceae bacterium]|nr:PASTA domain-containing protein [Pyrinomonadaceae bacterium]